MASNLAKKDANSSQIKKNLDGWKYPKIPVDQVYKKKILSSPNSIVKDFEQTITLKASNQNTSAKLLSRDLLKGFIKKQHEFLHLGLIQIAIKPLLRDGLDAPIIVCLKDARHLDFHNSLLALVEVNLCQGPFYFNCFPSFSVSLADASSFEVLTLEVKSGGIPLALTYRVVCKAMADLRPEALNEPVFGETTCFQPAAGTQSTTKWDEYELHETQSPARKQGLNVENEDLPETLPGSHVLQKGISMAPNPANEKESSFQFNMKLDEWKYPKIPVDQVYDKSNDVIVDSEFFMGPSFWSKAKKLLSIFPRYALKDFERTVTLRASNPSLSVNLLEGLVKMQKKGYVHSGLVQIAIKPLLGDGLEAPIIVCVRDARLLKFQDSLLALVESDLSEGPFYFDCCPGYSVPLQDSRFLTLNVITSGVPLVLTYRVVCKVTTDITLDYRNSTRGETTYFQPSTGTQSTTKWDEVQLPESWTDM